MTNSVQMLDDVIRRETDSEQMLDVLFNKAIEAVEISGHGFLTRDPDFRILDRKAYILCKSLYKVYMNRVINTSLIDPRILTYILTNEYENGGRKREIEKNMIHNTLNDMMNNKKKNMMNKLFLRGLFGTRLPW